jgi:hypothetical protein
MSIPASTHHEAATAGEPCRALREVMEQLLSCIEMETDCVRAGRLFAAAELKTRETALVGRYQQELSRLERNAGELDRVAPRAMARLRHEHEGFKALFQIGMAVLECARELAEHQMRELQAKVGISRAA